MSPLSGSHLLFLVLAAGGGLAAQDARKASSRLVSPNDPVEAVRSAFNAAKGKPRFLAVLSPT
ncbi:MAG: hypothetical protein ACE5F1_06790 [Planctomycetota bacterium]